VKRAAILLALAALAALAAPACGGKKDEPKPAEAAGSGPAAGSADTAAAAAGSADAAAAAAGSADAAAAAAEVDVPTEVDFETEAAASITEKTLEAQLKAVEQELAR
jgi:hypothetical protein